MCRNEKKLNVFKLKIIRRRITIRQLSWSSSSDRYTIPLRTSPETLIDSNICNPIGKLPQMNFQQSSDAGMVARLLQKTVPCFLLTWQSTLFACPVGTEAE